MDKKLSKLRRLRVKVVAYLIKRNALANVREWGYRVLYWVILLVHFHVVANVVDNTFSLADLFGLVANALFLQSVLLNRTK